MKASLTPEELLKLKDKFRVLSNNAEFERAYRLAKQLTKKYPEEYLFKYLEAVFSAEDDTGFTPAQIHKRHKSAARKLKMLLVRIRAVPLELRGSIRNEYYWFSHQPYKQYLLGIERVKSGERRAHYSQGVGAVELAKRYAVQGRKGLCLRWAKRSELAWRRFFKVDPNWFNSYFFYAMALGYQGRFDQMEKALETAARIAGKSMRWTAILDLRREILNVAALLNKTDRA